MKIIVVVPGFNEQKYLPKVLASILKITKNVLYVDDGSEDQSALLAKKYITDILVHATNLGKGAALKTGCEYAFGSLGADAVVIMDADDQHAAEDLKLFFHQLEKGAQVVFGIRRFSAQMPLIRYIGNKFASICVNVLFHRYIPDISSDLSLTATMIVPHSLKNHSITLCLFTSDFNLSPVRPDKKLPIIIYEALHHTKNIHETFDRLLAQNYKDILFVEPTTNFIVKFLARYDLAERVEYSGLKPSFLYIPKLKKLCKKYGYRLKIHTLWEFPEDYFRQIFGESILAEKMFLKFVDVCSFLGNIFHVGSMSVGVLERVD